MRKKYIDISTLANHKKSQFVKEEFKSMIATC